MQWAYLVLLIFYVSLTIFNPESQRTAKMSTVSYTILPRVTQLQQFKVWYVSLLLKNVPRVMWTIIYKGYQN